MAEKKQGRKASRVPSAVFNMFEQKQIQEFKEAFGLMDQDRDGTITIDDLKEVYASLGRVPKDSELQAMIDEASGPINFTMLLSLFGDRLGGTDEEQTILNAFKLYDPDEKGLIHRDNLKKIYCNEGKPDSRLTEKEFNQMLEGAPIDPKGYLDYMAFTRILKRGKEDDE